MRRRSSCLFDGQGRRELERIELPERNEDVWHGYLNDIARAALRLSRPRPLCARARPPLQRQQAAARSLCQADRRPAGVERRAFRLSHGSAREDLSFDRRDNARGMPKAVVVDETFNWGRREMAEHRLGRHHHLRGPRQGPDAKARRRRAGLARHLWRAVLAGVIDHLKRLGVTTIELLPIHGLIDDRVLVERKLANYWGYNTLAFFAPEPRYAQDNALDAFRTTVARLHDAGIEVMLDVVYNHTAEGNHLGPTLSFRGIDNASYYWLSKENPRYDDFTGCGSSVNLTHPRVLQMVMDSLRYWSRSATSTASASTSPPRWRAGRTAMTAIPRFRPRCGRTRCCQPSSSSPSRGTRHGRLSGRPFRRNGRNGTTAIAARCGVTGAAKAA